MKKIKKILHIDIEDGFGGSSRSLSLLIKHRRFKFFKSEIWVARNGPGLNRYRSYGNKCIINNNIKFLIPLRRNNFKNIIVSTFKIFNLLKLSKQIIKSDFDLIHLNHDGLLLLAFFLKYFKYNKKIVLHKRYIFPNNFYGKLFANLYSFVDGIICISKMERDNLLKLYPNYNKKLCIINNPSPLELLNNKISIKKKKSFKALYLGTLNHFKAADRIIDLAHQTNKINLPIKFSIFGKEPRKSLFKNKELSRNLLNKKIKEFKLEKKVKIYKETDKPEDKLIENDILIRPSRKNDAWGRDIIEAMSAGLFIISTGKEGIFLKNNINGILINEWKAKEVAEIIKLYTSKQNLFLSIKKKAKYYAKLNFDPTVHAKKVEDFLKKI
jgi:glycosyltransferase involved in cell wall biosynthesis